MSSAYKPFRAFSVSILTAITAVVVIVMYPLLWVILAFAVMGILALNIWRNP